MRGTKWENKMESQITYTADGETTEFFAHWHNAPMKLIFAKAPPKGTKITISTKEPENE